jgi:prepilin-type N-terminal cleavage/methylation domain-containing protein
VVSGQDIRGGFPAASPAKGAFTLIEMLIVIAIIAFLSALTLPSLQGLLGVSGVRGGSSTVLAAFDQARAAAIENGTDVYVGFPPGNFTDPGDPNTRFSALIVFRGAKIDEAVGTLRPLTRWLRLPSGVVMQITNMTLGTVTNASTNIPLLAGATVDPVVVRYDRFGRIVTTVTGGTNITVGEGVVSGDTVLWRGDNREFLTAQRLTGRWIVTRPLNVP